MIKRITLDEFYELLYNPMKATFQSIVDAFENIQKLIDELSDITEETEEKDIYSYAFLSNTIYYAKSEI